MKVLNQNKLIGIGGLGGSGTRAVAEIFLTLGYNLGDDLNGPNDNLVFTRLFKKPNWYRNSTQEDKIQRLEIFDNYMRGLKIDLNHFSTLFWLSVTNQNVNHRLSFYPKLIMRLFKSQNLNQSYGWKEPNSHLYISTLLEAFPSLKYIHVIRNGLDMAFSNNKQQLKNWGFLYDIDYNSLNDENEISKSQLKYWVETTRQMIQFQKLFPDSIYLLNHSSLCKNPKEEIDSLLNFVDHSVDNLTLEKLIKIPKNKGTNNRYKDHSLNHFPKDHRDFVNEMGFDIHK